MATVTVPALRRAIETRDGETLAGFYADDAVLRIVDQMNPPSRPNEIKGRDAIAAYYDDVCGRTMTHRVDSASPMAIGSRSPRPAPIPTASGCSAPHAGTGRGRIARQTAIQAWDE